MTCREVVEGLLAQNIIRYEQDQQGLRGSSVYLQFRPNRGSFTMEEPDPSATLKTVYVADIPNDCVILKPDNFGVRFFRSNSWNQACDYLFLATIKTEHYAIFVDLKSSLESRPDGNDNFLVIASKRDKKVEQQFIGACALFDYIKIIARKHHGTDLLDHYKVLSWVLYDSIKPWSPMQSNVQPTARERTKSSLVRAMEVHDAKTISIAKLICS